MEKYDVKDYVTADGKRPFREWLLGLKDRIAQAKLNARIARAEYGNFGDWKRIQGHQGLFEMREHHGAGYRVFYAIEEGEIILLLAGSTKKEQNKMIRVAAERLADYRKED